MHAADEYNAGKVTYSELYDDFCIGYLDEPLFRMLTDVKRHKRAARQAHDPDMPPEEKPLTGLWRNDPETPEGKYLVVRRDGTVTEWPHFVLAAVDYSSSIALRAYAESAEERGMNAQFVKDIRDLADTFANYAAADGRRSDPDRGRHRRDDPRVIELMREGGHIFEPAGAGVSAQYQVYEMTEGESEPVEDGPFSYTDAMYWAGYATCLIDQGVSSADSVQIRQVVEGKEKIICDFLPGGERIP